ncbi:MAG: glucosaminidase domain-containing protein [Treponema sp.]|jgi:hypothetical protein|nr:glucosaminidase domain-containing protein [Treponema sp.]
MKNKGRIFLVLVIFAVANGFGQEDSDDVNSDVLTESRNVTPSQSGTGEETVDVNSDVLKELRNISTLLQSVAGEETLPRGKLVPLTMDIVKQINPESRDLFKELGFYFSSDLALTAVPERKVEANKGGLVIDSGNTVQITKIPRTSKGEYHTYNPKPNEESFNIKFQEYDHELQFVRNTRTGRFDFYTADGSTTLESPRPYLCIFVYNTGDALPQRGAVSQQSGQSRVPAGSSASNQFQFLIMGSGRLSIGAIVSYIVNKGSALNWQQINALVSIYIREAQAEGINYDIAIAQMCYATRFLSNWQLLNTFNYAGLNTDIGISFRGDGSRHLNPNEGIRAHIQHLKGYASREPLRNPLVDRRYSLLRTSSIWGTVKTIEGLFAVWSPYNAQSYGYEIQKILWELYQFSGG